MTPEERAEKIITDMDCDSCQSNVKMRKQMTDLVTAEIRAAVEEAVLKEYEGDCSNVAIIEHKAYQRAIADAATICDKEADKYRECNAENIGKTVMAIELADKIRARIGEK